MENISNPFPVSGYHGEELFCNRNDEVKRLLSHILNGMHTTMLSVRRMGKTGLIYHLFNLLSKKRNMHCIYFDIYATQNQKDFTARFSTAVLQAFPKKKSIANTIMEYIKSLRPVISFDQFTGQPEVSFDFATQKQKTVTRFRGVTLLSHSDPSRPSYWFCGLIRIHWGAS